MQNQDQSMNEQYYVNEQKYLDTYYSYSNKLYINEVLKKLHNNDSSLSSILIYQGVDLKVLRYEKNIMNKLLYQLHKNKTVKRLTIDNLGDAYIDVEKLGRMLQSNDTIETLSLENNNLSNKGTIRLGEALRKKTKISHLYLRKNYIEDKGATQLANALKVNNTLQHLYLDHNEISQAAIEFADALKVNNTLRSLNLQYNGIGRGAIELAESLKKNKTLYELNLNHNNVMDDSAFAFANALKQNTSIKRIDLVSNNISDNGAKALADSLKENKSLKYLNLFNNYNITKVGIEAFYEPLKYNSSIISLSLQNLDRIQEDEFIKEQLNVNKIINQFTIFFLELYFYENFNAYKNVDKIFFDHWKNMEKSYKVMETAWMYSTLKTKQEARKNLYNPILRKFSLHNAISFADSKNLDYHGNKKQFEILQKFKEYLQITSTNFTISADLYYFPNRRFYDTYVPPKLLLELLELYIDHNIIRFYKTMQHLKTKVLEKLKRIVAFEYMNILRHFLPNNEVEKLDDHLNTLTSTQLQKQTQKQTPKQKQITQKQNRKQQTSTSSTIQKQTQKQTQRPYYKKLERKLFDVHYATIINKITQSNKKKFINFNDIIQIENQLIRKRNQLEQLENLSQINLILKKSKKLLTQQEKEQIRDLQQKLNDRKKLRKQIQNLHKNMNVMINNQRLNKLKQIKQNQMDVIQSQTQRIQKKILDNMLPETFMLKFPINKKQKLQLQQQQLQQQQKNRFMFPRKPPMKRPRPRVQQQQQQQRKDKKIRQNQKKQYQKKQYTIRDMSLNGHTTSSSKTNQTVFRVVALNANGDTIIEHINPKTKQKIREETLKTNKLEELIKNGEYVQY